MIELTVDAARFWTFAGQRPLPLRVRNGMRQVDVADLV